MTEEAAASAMEVQEAQPTEAAQTPESSSTAIPTVIDPESVVVGLPEPLNPNTTITGKVVAPSAPAETAPETAGPSTASVLVSLTKEFGAAQNALAHLKTSSNADFKGTIVGDAVAKFEAAFKGIEEQLSALKSKL